MKISFTGPAFRNMDRGVGYGEASWNIYNSFKKLKIDVEIEAKKADIEICFADPRNYNFNDPLSYKICYTAWESTDVSPTFKEKMNKCDEIWATSDWVANVYREIFPNKIISTYKHGINEMWKPKLRKESHKPFTFLHIGEPYSRKDAQLVVDCFLELFENNPDYRLVLKCTKMNTTKIKIGQGYLVNPTTVHDNIVEITGSLSPKQMVELYDICDVFVYPSWGEGFGFQPLQAEASGMPSISTAGWADYSKYITFPLKSRWHNSPWPDIHQGMMMKPEKEDLKKQMINSVKDYKKVLPIVFKNSFDIHREYDWIEVTKPAVARLRMIYANILLEKKYFNFSELKKNL